MNPYVGMLSLAVVSGLTIWVFSDILRCRHAWEFVDKTELPSRIEEAAKSGITSEDLYTDDIPEMSKKKVVIVLRCPKCGKTQIIRESN